jgi:hypothetical protein
MAQIKDLNAVMQESKQGGIGFLFPDGTIDNL